MTDIPSSMPWVKAYTSDLDDVRLMRTSDDAQLAYFKLERLAGKCDADGYFILNGEQLSEDEIAFYVRMETRKLKASIKELCKNKLMNVNGHGPVITDFASRQVSQAKRRELWRERQARHRGATGDSKDSHAPVTGDTSASHSPRTRIQNQNQSPESESESNPPPIPSSRNKKKYGGRDGWQ